MTILANSSPPQCIALTALPRPPETDTGNLFVRLTPATAWRLARSMLPGDDGDHGDEDEEVGEVEFLPLEITFRNRKSPRLNEDARHGDLEGDEYDGDSLTIYASYNGGAPASSRGPGSHGESAVCSMSSLSFSLWKYRKDLLLMMNTVKLCVQKTDAVTSVGCG